MAIAERLFKKRCDRGIHKFEARYDEHYKDGAKFEATQFCGPYANILEILKAMINKTYIKDICIFCGKEIKRG